MKATGIVRRIDDLGRVVIPKEIRKTLRIKEGTPLEIFTDREGQIILKKYSPMMELGSFAKQYAESVAQTMNQKVAVSDRDQIIAVAGMPKKELVGKSIHKDLEDVINDREAVIARRGDTKYVNITSDDTDYAGQVIQTIICEGDAIGAVIVLSKDDKMRFGETEQKTAIIAANFLGKQMEN